MLPVSDIYNAWTHFWLSPNSETGCCRHPVDGGRGCRLRPRAPSTVCGGKPEQTGVWPCAQGPEHTGTERIAQATRYCISGRYCLMGIESRFGMTEPFGRQTVTMVA